MKFGRCLLLLLVPDLGAIRIHAFSTQPVAKLKVLYDANQNQHVARYDHPECPARAAAAVDLLSSMPEITVSAPSCASAEDGDDARQRAHRALLRVHEDWYLEDIETMSKRGGGKIDHDTYVAKGTYDVCLTATGAWLDCVDSVVKDGIPAFAVTRPPGHHAVSAQAMGFCIFNYAAAAAMYALEELGLERVALLDYDVHYGNGVAAAARKDARLRYCSLHEAGSFPGTGMEELAAGPHKNLRLLEVHTPSYGVVGTDTWDSGYGARFENEAVPWLAEHDPQLIIVSAGYDALEADELANMRLQPEDYGKMSELLKKTFGSSKIMFGLEGGYAVSETAQAIKHTVTPFLT